MAKLYFYYAAMNAGKSTTLLQSDCYRERGMRTLLFAPNLDNRYGEGLITCLGIQAKATITRQRLIFFARLLGTP